MIRVATRRSLRIRELRRRDLAAVMRIEREAYPKPWSEHVFRTELDEMRAGHRAYIAAHQGHALAGYAGLIFQLDDAHVSNIAVAPERRRHGVGRRLLAELGWIAHRRGSTAMTLEVRHTNIGAQALYRSFGFDVAGTRPRYYEGVDDAIVMWRLGVGDGTFTTFLREWCPGSGAHG